MTATIINKKQYQEAGASLGWKTVYDVQYNATGEATWLPFAQAIKDKGVKGLCFVGSAVNLAQLHQLAGPDRLQARLGGRSVEHVRPSS